MGAVCGKGHRLKDDEAPYETKENAPRSAEKSASKKKTDSAPASAAEIAENGHENLIEEVEDEIQQKRAEEVKSEVKPPGMSTNWHSEKIHSIFISAKKHDKKSKGVGLQKAFSI